MFWGTLELNPEMGSAAAVLVEEYERRLEVFGPQSYEVQAMSATELGFEHNLGLLHKAHYVSGRQLRRGVPEREYYLERCLLEAAGASLVDRAMLACSSIVGDAVVRDKYRQMFGVNHEVVVPPHLQVPELRLQLASTVGAAQGRDERRECELLQHFQGDSNKRDVVAAEPYPAGFCYLALIRSERIADAIEVLGPNPRLVDLLQFGSDGAFASDAELSAVGLHQTSMGYHASRDAGGIPFLSVLRVQSHDGLGSDWDVGGAHREMSVGADSAKIMCDWLSAYLGRESKLSDQSLQLVTSSAALLGNEQKKQLRSLEALGDAALSMMIARDNYLRGQPVEMYQTVRSNVTSNKILTDKFVEHVPRAAVAFVSGVDPRAGVTGAKALEAIFGAVWLDLGDAALSKLLVKMGFVESPLQVPVVSGLGLESRGSAVHEARVGGWFGASDDPVGHRYQRDAFLHVSVSSGSGSCDALMHDLGAGAVEGTKLYLSDLARDAWVHVVFDGPAEPNKLCCWYLGPAYSARVKRVQLEDGRVYEFPSFGGLAFWAAGSIRAKVEVSGLTSLACYVREFEMGKCPLVSLEDCGDALRVELVDWVADLSGDGRVEISVGQSGGTVVPAARMELSALVNYYRASCGAVRESDAGDFVLYAERWRRHNPKDVCLQLVYGESGFVEAVYLIDRRPDF